VQLIILEEADADTDRLFEFLVENNPIAAQKAVLAIDDAMQRLLDNPYVGTPNGTLPDIRELYIRFGKRPYVLQYRIDDKADALVVMRIWHSRENRI